MKAELKLDCSICGVEDITIDINIKGKKLPFFKEISEKGKEQGWHIGKNCYCPECQQSIKDHCSNCEYYEGNKSMGASICRRDGSFTTPGDSCEHHKAYIKE